MVVAFMEEKLESDIWGFVRDSERLSTIYRYLSTKREIDSLLEMSNIVMIVRCDYNDHGKVHAMLTLLNSLRIIDILGTASMVRDKIGTLEDAKVAVMLGSYLHDIGNAVNRFEHETLSVILAKPFVEEILSLVYRGDENKKQKIAATVYDCIYSHMGTHSAESIEAGVVATADGCDMEKGRARIPYKLGKSDIHKLSALAIDKVKIVAGEAKPVRIEVEMNNPAGVFQIEEILLRKIDGTGFRGYVEVVAKVGRKTIIY